MKSSENNGGLRRAPHLFSLLVAVLALIQQAATRKKEVEQ